MINGPNYCGNLITSRHSHCSSSVAAEWSCGRSEMSGDEKLEGQIIHRRVISKKMAFLDVHVRNNNGKMIRLPWLIRFVTR